MAQSVAAQYGPMKVVSRLRTKPMRYKYHFLLLIIFFVSSFLIISFSNNSQLLGIQEYKAIAVETFNEIKSGAGFTIKTNGCIIPGLTPFDDAIKKFTQHQTQVKRCPNANVSFLQHNKTHIWVDKETLYNYYIPREENITCCYQAFYRPSSIDNVNSQRADDRATYYKCSNFTDSQEIVHDEFAKITCSNNDTLINEYNEFFIFAHEKPKRTDLAKTPSPHYNVIVMGMDGTSRLNVHRTMPKTLSFIKKKGAIELLGYNKVGYNTFPNVISMLLGINETNLKKTCWPHYRNSFDNCPFIWNSYDEAGFYTAFGEDSANLGTFNYGKYGFLRKPTDYYMRTFISEANKLVGNTKDVNTNLCMGGKYFYQVLLDYIEDLTFTLRNRKLFGFFWEVSMSHDYLNYPKAMDDSYATFFEKLDSFNYLNNTIVILLSDHGIRWGGIRRTKQGRLEERLPAAHILVPESFKNKYHLAYENLKLNSKRLTSPLDIHATLSDLVNLDHISDNNIKQRTKSDYTLSSSVSLFVPISTNRTCKLANIDDNWCTCAEPVILHPNDFESITAAGQVVEKLNDILKEHRQCAQLFLSAVLEVTEMTTGESERSELIFHDYMAVVKTSPGNGIFEGNLRQLGNQWSIDGIISRLNLYGESKCMPHEDLKMYCYCL